MTLLAKLVLLFALGGALSNPVLPKTWTALTNTTTDSPDGHSELQGRVVFSAIINAIRYDTLLSTPYSSVFLGERQKKYALIRDQCTITPLYGPVPNPFDFLADAKYNGTITFEGLECDAYVYQHVRDGRLVVSSALFHEDDPVAVHEDFTTMTVLVRYSNFTQYVDSADFVLPDSCGSGTIAVRGPKR